MRVGAQRGRIAGGAWSGRGVAARGLGRVRAACWATSHSAAPSLAPKEMRLPQARRAPRRAAGLPLARAAACGGAGEPSALRAAEEAVLPHARPWRRPALLPRTVPPRAAPSPATWRPHETHPTEQRQRRRALPAPRVAHLRLGVAPPSRGARAQRRAPPRARPRWRLMKSRRAGRAAGLGGGHGERGRRRARKEASDAAPRLAELKPVDDLPRLSLPAPRRSAAKPQALRPLSLPYALEGLSARLTKRRLLAII